MSNVLSGFRRSQRLMFEIPVEVYASRNNEEPTYEVARSLTVNAHGGLLAMTTLVGFGEILRLRNPATQMEVECRVCRFGMSYPGGVNQVGVEFLKVSPAFWNITSPPADWDPAWVPPTPRERPEPPLPPPDAESEPAPKRVRKPASNNVRKITEEAVKAQRESGQIKEKDAEPIGWRFLSWPTFALAGLVGLIVLFVAISYGSRTAAVPAASAGIAGVAPEQARLIPGIENYRLAMPADFDQAGVSWMVNSGQQVAGEIPGSFSALGQSNAYVLAGKDGMWRIVILADGKLRCDAQYRSVALVARVARGAIQKIVWATPPPIDSEGDGLLVVRSVNDLGSAVVLFLRGGQVVSGTPSGSWQIPLS